MTLQIKDRIEELLRSDFHCPTFEKFKLVALITIAGSRASTNCVCQHPTRVVERLKPLSWKSKSSQACESTDQRGNFE